MKQYILVYHGGEEKYEAAKRDILESNLSKWSMTLEIILKERDIVFMDYDLTGCKFETKEELEKCLLDETDYRQGGYPYHEYTIDTVDVEPKVKVYVPFIKDTCNMIKTIGCFLDEEDANYKLNEYIWENHNLLGIVWGLQHIGLHSVFKEIFDYDERKISCMTEEEFGEEFKKDILHSRTHFEYQHLEHGIDTHYLCNKNDF